MYVVHNRAKEDDEKMKYVTSIMLNNSFLYIIYIREVRSEFLCLVQNLYRFWKFFVIFFNIFNIMS